MYIKANLGITQINLKQWFPLGRQNGKQDEARGRNPIWIFYFFNKIWKKYFMMLVLNLDQEYYIILCSSWITEENRMLNNTMQELRRNQQALEKRMFMSYENQFAKGIPK